MRCSPKRLLPLALLVACSAALAQGPTYNLGRAPTPEEEQALGLTVGPSGRELPPGSGTAKEGAKIFSEKCSACHGDKQEGSPLGPRLVGGQGTLTTPHPLKTVGSFWGYSTIIWDYINRAMPLMQPGSLTPDEVYALSAFLLYRNDIITETDVMDAKTLPKVQMPNRNGFFPAVPKWPEDPETRHR